MSTKTWGPRPYFIEDNEGCRQRISVAGRERWALDLLRQAGETGCTPITHPGPRWSSYVFDLREMGVAIETIRERHGGPFPGTHARYVLRMKVSPVTEAKQ